MDWGLRVGLDVCTEAGVGKDYFEFGEVDLDEFVWGGCCIEATGVP